MTERERQYASLGLHYAEGIERCLVVHLPNGREIRRRAGAWEVQPWHDNFWRRFGSLLAAVRYATRPTTT